MIEAFWLGDTDVTVNADFRMRFVPLVGAVASLSEHKPKCELNLPFTITRRYLAENTRIEIAVRIVEMRRTREVVELRPELDPCRLHTGATASANFPLPGQLQDVESAVAVNGAPVAARRIPFTCQPPTRKRSGLLLTNRLPEPNGNSYR